MKIKDVITLLLLAKFIIAYSTRPIEVLNGFLIAYGYLMKDPSDYSVVTATSLAACRMRCVTVNTSCVTVSMFKRENGSVECRLSRNIVHEIHFNNVDGGFTFAKVSSFKHYLGKDGMFYTIINILMDWAKMDSSCKYYYKTGKSLMLKYMDQIESSSAYFATQYAASQYSGLFGVYFNLNLTFVSKLSANTWGDGTLLADSESGKQVTTELQTGTKTFELQLPNSTSWKFVGKSASRQTSVACQLNPFNFD